MLGRCSRSGHFTCSLYSLHAVLCGCQEDLNVSRSFTLEARRGIHAGWFYCWSSSVWRSHISYVVICICVFTISICVGFFATLMKLYNIVLVVRLLSLCLCVQWSVVISFKLTVVWRMLQLLLRLLCISVFTNIMSNILNLKIVNISKESQHKPHFPVSYR